MVEYLFDAIKAVAGETFTVTAEITDELQEPIKEQCSLVIYAEREGTGFYVKQNGQYKEVQVVLKKINGVWQEVQASELSRTANYVMRN